MRTVLGALGSGVGPKRGASHTGRDIKSIHGDARPFWHKSQAQLHPDHRRPKGVGRVARAPRAVGHDGLAPLGRNGRHGGGLQLREARDEARDDLGPVCREVVVLARVFLDVEEARRLRRQGATAT